MLKLDHEARCDEDPGFRDMVFVLGDEKELSVDQTLSKITLSQWKQLDGLCAEARKHIPGGPATSFLSNFAELKGI
jgi:hypothetical protein